MNTSQSVVMLLFSAHNHLVPANSLWDRIPLFLAYQPSVLWTQFQEVSAQEWHLHQSTHYSKSPSHSASSAELSLPSLESSTPRQTLFAALLLGFAIGPVEPPTHPEGFSATQVLVPVNSRRGCQCKRMKTFTESITETKVQHQWRNKNTITWHFSHVRNAVFCGALFLNFRSMD